jgi:hypothetical protein
MIDARPQKRVTEGGDVGRQEALHHSRVTAVPPVATCRAAND